MLKAIPVEEATKQKSKKIIPQFQNGNGHHQDDHFFRNICGSFMSFINRGAQYTIGQIDDLIMGLQRSILRLQKKKHQLLEHERQKNKESSVRFKKRKIV